MIEKIIFWLLQSSWLNKLEVAERTQTKIRQFDENVVWVFDFSEESEVVSEIKTS